MAGSDSLCAIRGSGQFSQPVNLAQAVNMDPYIAGQSDAEEYAIMDNGTDSAGTDVAWQTERRDVGFSSRATGAIISRQCNPIGQQRLRDMR